jgi:alkanesulfonate monooxygenase SsuD/methylene tetrahydromethanopterin reductase-like flavin-dependent oxidoreductase (luciferase family)
MAAHGVDHPFPFPGAETGQSSRPSIFWMYAAIGIEAEVAWLINSHASLPTLERQMALYRRTLAAGGRPFPGDAPILKEFHIAGSRRAALEESKPYLEPKYRAYADWGLDKPMPKGERLSVPLDDLARDRFIPGTPDECRADIDRDARLLGVHHFIFRIQWPGMPQEDAMKQIELLGRDVVARSGR